MKNVRENAPAWVAGTAIAFIGVALARVVAPNLEGSARLLLTGAGELLALGGLFMLCLVVRRRIRATDATVPGHRASLSRPEAD